MQSNWGGKGLSIPSVEELVAKFFVEDTSKLEAASNKKVFSPLPLASMTMDGEEVIGLVSGLECARKK